MKLVEKLMNVLAGAALICLIPSGVWFIWTENGTAAKVFWTCLICFLGCLIIYPFFFEVKTPKTKKKSKTLLK